MNTAVRRDFDEFYALHFANIVTMAYSLTGSFDEAQDITQESFCRAWQRWAGLSTYDNPITWVRRVAINLATSRWRQLRTATAHRMRQRVEEPAVAPTDSDHVDIVAELRRLPAGQRSALVLHYLLDLPIEQVAEQLQAPVGTIKAWLYRGRKSLAAQLATQIHAVPDKPATDEIIQRAHGRRNRKITIVGGVVLLALAAAVVSATFIHRPSPVITPTPTPAPSELLIDRSAQCTFQTGRGAEFAEVLDRETIAKGKLVGDDEALLVTSSPNSGNLYVLWRGRRFEIRRPVAAHLAPGIRAMPVAQAFLDALPAGQPIEPVDVDGAGRVSDLNPRWKVGEVIQVFGVASKDRYVLVRQDGLFWVTQLQAALAAFSGRRESIGDTTDNGRIAISTSLLPRIADEPGLPPGDLPYFLTEAGSSLCSIGADGNAHRQTLINVPPQ